MTQVSENPTATHAMMKTKAEKQGWILVSSKPYSPHPLDNYLAIALCKSNNGEKWVTWMYNACFDGFGHGHYYSNGACAVEDFNERGRHSPVSAG